jgi:hypothetical protein
LKFLKHSLLYILIILTYILMMEKVVTKCSLGNWSKIKDDLNYWLSKTPQERIAAVEQLRRQHYGNPAGIQRTARVVKRS